MRKGYFLLLLSMFAAGSANPQNHGTLETSFRSIFDKKEKLNGYYFGNNPAYLHNELSSELLSLKSLFENSDGEYKSFLTPGNTRNYSLTASGKKTIDSFQVFKGSFSFLRKENNNWQWMFSRDYSGSSNFIIGDSTTGNSRYNGIVMLAEYAALLSEKFSVGFNLNYGVDEGLKQVSPRPTSRNREIEFTAGLSYNLTESSTLGVSASVYDDVERIAYREDDGSISKETIILKFRGFDYPNIFRKKTETRYTYNNGYSAGINYNYGNDASFNLAAYAKAGFNKYNVKDDDVTLINEGFTKNNFASAGLIGNYYLSHAAVLGLKYNFNYTDGWSRYPAFNVVYGNNLFNYHTIAAGLEYRLSDNLTAGIEPGIALADEEINDYYSNIFFTKKSLKYFISAGLNYKWTENFFTFLSAAAGKEGRSNSSLKYDSFQSSYFSLFRINDLKFWLAEENRYHVNFITGYTPSFGGEILLNLNYIYLNSGQGNYMNNLNRNNVSAFIEYRVKAY